MTKTPTKVIVNCETGEQEIVSLTTEEIAAMEANRKAWEEEQAQQKAKAEAKASAKISALAKLAALGLTEEEAAAIAG